MKSKPKKKVAVKKPDWKKAGAKAEALAFKSIPQQEAGLDKICLKFNVPKTPIRKIMKDVELEKEKQDKKEERKLLDKERENKQTEKIQIRKAKEEVREKKEAEKESKRQEKEQKKAERDADKEAKKQQIKLLLDELEETWETCDDDLFVQVFEADWRKGVHYFTQRLIKDYNFKVIDDNDDVIIYCSEGDNEGIYLQDAEKMIAIFCENRLGEKAVIVNVREIISKIQRTERLKISRESIFENDKNIIAVKNGIVNMNTNESEPFNPDKVFLSKANAKHNPKAVPKLWNKFLETSLPGKEGEIKTIQEYMGYTLSNDNSKQKAIITHGSGAAGQSVLQEVGGNLIGEDSITHLSIQEIEQDVFATAQLFGKKANMNPDLPKKALGESSKVKKIIRGERIHAQKKGKDGFSLRPHCKLWFGCNQIPTTSDHSDGFFRSFLPIKFNEQFLEGDPRRIEDLSRKICESEEEMSGILNWCIEGYNRLEEQGQFTKCFSIQEVKDFWLENSDTVSAFFKNMVVMTVDGEELKQDVYDKYVAYCQKMKKPEEEMNIFFKGLKNICEYKEITPGVNSFDRRRRLQGISILSLDLIDNTEKEVTDTGNTG